MLFRSLINFLVEQEKSTDETQYKVQIRIMNLGNMSDYAKVLGFLHQQENVRHISVLDTSKTQTDFSIIIKGNIQQLKQAISSDTSLKPMLDSFNNGDQPNDLLVYSYTDTK